MLNLLMRILIFQILKLINLNIWNTLLTIQAADCFSCNHLLHWKMFLWNLWILHLKIKKTDFKQSIIRNYKCFDEWFTKHSTSDWNVFLKKRKNFHRSTEMIFFFIKFNKYMNSEEFENGTMNLLNSYNQDVKGPALRLLTSVLIYLERSFLQTLCSHLQ